MARRPITGSEAAKIIGVSASTMRSWRKRGQGPPYRQPGGPGTQALYDPEMVELFKLRMKTEHHEHAR